MICPNCTLRLCIRWRLRCDQVRPMSIMSRAKRAAGLPPNIEDKVIFNPLNRQIKAQQHPIRSDIRSEVPDFIPLAVRAADITQRLTPAAVSVVQPPSPHILKCTIIGPANAGKSTLVNSLIGEKVSIVSARAQTTRERVVGVMTEQSHQVVFYDTPGIVSQQHRHRVNRQVIVSSWSSLQAVDHIFIVLDAAKLLYKERNTTEEYMFQRLGEYTLPATLIFNKIDELIPPAILQQTEAKQQAIKLGYPFTNTTIGSTEMQAMSMSGVWDTLNNHPQQFSDIVVRSSPILSSHEPSSLHSAITKLIQLYQARYPFIQRVLACSANSNWGIDGVKQHLKQLSQPGDHLYSSQQRTETAKLALVEQFIREGFFQKLWGYLPYALEQSNCTWLDMPDGTLRIVQNLFVSRAGQEKIVVGRAGCIVKQVQDQAKRELERIFKRPVELFIDVKVRKSPR